jgi:hypothetical protein
MSIEFVTDFEDPVCTLSTWRSLLLCNWHAQPTMATMTGLMKSLPAVERRMPHGFVACTLVPAGTGLPDAETRAHMGASIRRLEERCVATVNVVQGTGFATAAVRAVMAGLVLVVRSKRPTAFVATPAEATHFLVTHWPAADRPAPVASELAAALEDIAAR